MFAALVPASYLGQDNSGIADAGGSGHSADRNGVSNAVGDKAVRVLQLLFGEARRDDNAASAKDSSAAVKFCMIN